MSKSISIKKLDATQDVPFEFEYKDEDGELTGVFFSVYGEQSKRVTGPVQAMIDEDRQRDAQRSLKTRTGGNRDNVFIKPVAEDKKFGIDAAALRLAGWRSKGMTEGLTKEQLERFTPIDEVFTPELGHELVSTNQHVQMAIMRESGRIKNFTKI